MDLGLSGKFSLGYYEAVGVFGERSCRYGTPENDGRAPSTNEIWSLKNKYNNRILGRGATM